MEPNFERGIPTDAIEQSRNIQELPPGSGNSMDPSELIESLLDNSHVPKDLQNQLWVLFGKTTKLSFIKESDVNDIMLQFELLRLTILESVPKNAYNDSLEMTLIQIGIEFRLNLRRSVGGRLNERELLGASTNATFSDQRTGKQTEDPGFLSKIARLFQ